MDAVDWTALSALAAIVLGSVGYLAHRLERLADRIDGLETRLDDRLRAEIGSVRADVAALSERYVRHLEAHAMGSAP